MSAHYFDQLDPSEQFTIRKAINLTTIYSGQFRDETFPILITATLELLTVKLGVRLQPFVRISLSNKRSLKILPYGENDPTDWMIVNALVRDIHGTPHFASLLIWPSMYLGIPYPVKWEIKK